LRKPNRIQVRASRRLACLDAPVDGEAPATAAGVKRLNWWVATDPGRARRLNEDAYLFVELDARRGIWAFGVADGMGGHRDGELASAMAVEVVREHLAAVCDGLTRSTALSSLREAVNRADSVIRRASPPGPPDSSGRHMGTTLTVGLTVDATMYLCHAGDSRSYLWRGGRLEVLTADHSVAAELAKKGEISPEDVESHPHRHVLTRAIGGGNAAPDCRSIEIRDDDVLLFCTDGLTVAVDEGGIADVLSRTPLPAVPSTLVGLANERGGRDNVTVLVVECRSTNGPATG